jgi:glycosidase
MNRTRTSATAVAALTMLACQGAPNPPADSASPSAASSAGVAATGAGTRVAGQGSTFHPEWSRDAVIYEVNVRQYTPEGTFAALETHLPRLKQLGVDILWLMPVQPIGKKNRKGVLGSYYSISDYRAINPEFGSRADAQGFIDAAHGAGMKVILDWVPNHTAYDHPWVAAHPDWYERGADGSIHNARDNEGRETDWTDVAELNYASPAMRQAMLADMRYWLDTMKLDGFRCDVAGGVPNDFWAEARRTLAAGRPGLFMLAEAETPAMHAAFDMTYGWSLYELLVEVSQGKKGAAALDAYFAREDSLYPADAYRMNFTPNHDKNSWDGTEFERMGANHAPSYVLSATAGRSMPLLYTGQEVSMKKRLRFFERDTVDWRGPSLAPFYSALFALKHAHPALANGASGGPQVRLKTSAAAGSARAAGDRVYAFTRTRDTSTVLVAVNFGDAPARAQYEGLARPGVYTDWFGKGRAELGVNGTVQIPAHGYRVFAR